MEEIKCPVCEVSETDHIGEYKNKNKMFGEKTLNQCRRCKLIFVSPMPSKEDLDWYYKNVWLGEGSVMSQSKESELIYDIQAAERVNYLSKHINLNQEMKIIDVGSGYGCLFDKLIDYGLLSKNLCAADPNPENINRLKKKNIIAFSGISQVARKDFDLATACFVLEHVPDPLEFLRAIADHVRKGGFIFLDIPERDDTFKQILEPHLAVYTSESLKNVLNKAGLRVIHMTGYGIRRSKLAREAALQSFLPVRIFNFILKGLKRILSVLPYYNNMKNRIRCLYRYYEFDQEGDGRWWIRVIAQKA